MKRFPVNRNSLALVVVGIIGVGFFIAGLLKILDYFIVKALFFVSFGVLGIIALIHALKNDTKKKSS